MIIVDGRGIVGNLFRFGENIYRAEEVADIFAVVHAIRECLRCTFLLKLHCVQRKRRDKRKSAIFPYELKTEQITAI